MLISCRGSFPAIMLAVSVPVAQTASNVGTGSLEVPRKDTRALESD